MSSTEAEGGSEEREVSRTQVTPAMITRLCYEIRDIKRGSSESNNIEVLPVVPVRKRTLVLRFSLLSLVFSLSFVFIPYTPLPHGHLSPLSLLLNTIRSFYICRS